MHLSVPEMQKAAKVAAAKYFSNDQAMDQDDLESIAMMRILDRDPTTIATAVHVGREGIMREVKYRRYEKACNTIQLSVLDTDDGKSTIDYEKPERDSENDRRVKYQRFIKNLSQSMGKPIELFGRFGLAYRKHQIKPSVEKQFFWKSIHSRPSHLFRCRQVTDEMRQLAETDFVLAVIHDGELQFVLPFLRPEFALKFRREAA